MLNTAIARTRIETVVSLPATLALLLGVNTLVLLGLDHVGGIPAWIKTAAALFLAF